MMRDHKPISIADQVFEQLERDILTGKYPQGEVLSEMRLSSELGVSRTSLREAIKTLVEGGTVSDVSVPCFIISQENIGEYDITQWH